MKSEIKNSKTSSMLTQIDEWNASILETNDVLISLLYHYLQIYN